MWSASGGSGAWRGQGGGVPWSWGEPGLYVTEHKLLV